MYIEKNSRKPLILFLYIIDEDIAATRDKNKKIYKTRTDGWMIRKNGSNRERDTHAQLGGRAADYYWLYMCCWAGLGWRECTRYISLYMWCTSSLTNYNFKWKCLYTRFVFFYFIEIKFSFLSYSIYLKILICVFWFVIVRFRVVSRSVQSTHFIKIIKKLLNKIFFIY